MGVEFFNNPYPKSKKKKGSALAIVYITSFLFEKSLHKVKMSQPCIKNINITNNKTNK